MVEKACFKDHLITAAERASEHFVAEESALLMTFHALSKASTIEKASICGNPIRLSILFLMNPARVLAVCMGGSKTRR